MPEIFVPDKSLIREMDVAAPRYTSYPTIPVWQPANSDEQYVAVLQQHSDDTALTLYFHIPFCPRICHYCGCNSILLDNDAQTRTYVAHVLKELQIVRKNLQVSHRVAHIHFGGGTPTVLESDSFQAIFSSVRENFEITSDTEWAIETNPMTCTDEKLAFLLENGFNRFSLGVQDFDTEVQERIGRFQTLERTTEFCEKLRAHCIRSLNFDLVYGLPTQTLTKMERTLDQVIELNPDRIAVYSFAYLPKLKTNQESIDGAELPDTDTKFDLYRCTAARLQEAGYVMIGMDHYAKPGDELAKAWQAGKLRRNFMGYTTGAETDVIALGATGISDVSGYYCQNKKKVAEYAADIEAGHLPVQRHIQLDADDKLRRRVIMDLLCNAQVEKTQIEEAFSINFNTHFASALERLTPLIERELLTNEKTSIKATALGRYFLRNIALLFDNYLDGEKGTGEKATFSRTV